MSGYSYTTISIDPGQQPKIGVSIHPDEHAEVTYYSARNDGSRDFIRLAHAGANVHICIPDQTQVTGTHVAFARELFHAAAAFLADCERLTTTGTGTAGATGKADQAGEPLDQGAA
ncbi:hypothetical protein AB0K60_32875 [Thermopolyspora sp. NPDC052614]|uniref:hypothetical protein n=1 Tax=Thermopolyspora sp. NPDC052614 TaxID=3155682 RepID=UPI0034333E76